MFTVKSFSYSTSLKVNSALIKQEDFTFKSNPKAAFYLIIYSFTVVSRSEALKLVLSHEKQVKRITERRL